MQLRSENRNTLFQELLRPSLILCGLPYINSVAVPVFKNEGPETIIVVAQSFDDT